MAIKTPMTRLILAAIVLSGLFFMLRLKNEMADFEVNYTAGQRIRSGETLYRAADGHWQFKYLPFSALLYVPLTLLPLPLAKAVWLTAIMLAAFLIFRIAFNLIDYKGNTLFSPAFFASLIVARYFLREFELGQINALITCLLVVCIWLLTVPSKPSADLASGALAGLAAALKPYAVVFLPYLAVRKKWLALAGGSAILIIAVLAPALFYGWRGNWVVLGEWKSSLATSTPLLLSSQDNVSLLGFLTKRTQGQTLSLAIYGAILAFLGGLILVIIRRGGQLSRPFVLEGFLLLLLIPLVSPLGWDYTFLAAAPALMLVCRHFDKYRPFWKTPLVLNSLIVSLSLYDVMGRNLYAAFMSVSIITVNFILFIGYLVYLRIKGYA